MPRIRKSSNKYNNNYEEGVEDLLVLQKNYKI